MTLLETLDKDMAPYRNKYGFVTDGEGNLDHNPLFHGFYVAIKQRLGLLDVYEINRERKLIQTLIHPEFPGVLMSAPIGGKNSNPYSHDNERAMFWLSKVLNMTYAEDFLKHGRKTGWNYNSLVPWIWSLEGQYERFPGMLSQAMISKGEKLGLVSNVLLHAEILGSAYKERKDIENMTLPYFMCKTIKDYSWYSEKTVSYWQEKGYKKYPGGMGEVFHSWGGSWKSHPFVKYYHGIIDVT